MWSVARFILPIFILLLLAGAFVLSQDAFRSVAGDVSEDMSRVDLQEEIAFKPLETPVEVVQLKKQSLVQSISTNGRTKTLLKTKITSQVSGIVTELRVREGEFVKKDSVLLKIKDEPFRIAYLQAKDKLNNRLNEYAFRMLLNGQTVVEQIDISTSIDTSNINDREAATLLSVRSHKERIASVIGLTKARLELRNAELALEHTVIRAPFDGFVTDLETSQGSMIHQTEPLMWLVSLDSLIIEVGILETELQLIHKGAEAQIELAAFPGKQIKGIVKTISPIIKEKSGTCNIQIEIANPIRKVRPGMFAHVNIRHREFRNRLLIPRDALLLRDDRKVVFVYEQGVALWRYIKTGLENDHFIEVTEGLGEGEALIISGHFNLAHEAKVLVVEK